MIPTGCWYQIQLCATVLYSLGHDPRNTDDTTGYRAPPPKSLEGPVIGVNTVLYD